MILCHSLTQFLRGHFLGLPSPPHLTTARAHTTPLGVIPATLRFVGMLVFWCTRGTSCPRHNGAPTGLVFFGLQAASAAQLPLLK